MVGLKTPKQMERHLKGMSNHNRIAILLVVAETDDITLEAISKTIDANSKTISEHTRRLLHARLLNKQYRGRFVVHSLSPYGRTFVRFLQSFQKA